MPMEVETGQPVQIDFATPRACQEGSQSSAEVPDPAAVFTWSEEKLLELRCEPLGTSRGA